jgi:hypothetical protein
MPVMSLGSVMIGHRSGTRTDAVSGARYEIDIIAIVLCHWNEDIVFIF